MAISTTTSFNPDLLDLAEEAAEISGFELRSGNDIRTARRSLNYLLLEWANKGINLWTLDEQTISSATVAAGTATYDIDIDTISILDAVVRTNSGSATSQSDTTLERISSTTYSQIPNKLTQGRPSQFWFNRVGIKDVTSGTNRPGTITLFPVPDQSNVYEIVYWRMRRMADAGVAGNTTAEVPERFLPALAVGLAMKLAMKKPELANKVPQLRADYNILLDEAMEEVKSEE